MSPIHVCPNSQYLPTVGGVSQFLSRAATSIIRAGEALAWRPRPPGPTDSDPAVRAFRVKLGNAYRPALACFLATGVSMVYPWSNKVTWFSITLSISGVGRNLVRLGWGFDYVCAVEGMSLLSSFICRASVTLD